MILKTILFAKSKVKVVHKKDIKKKHTKQQYHQKDSPFTLLVSQIFFAKVHRKKIRLHYQKFNQNHKDMFCLLVYHSHGEAYKK